MSVKELEFLSVKGTQCSEKDQIGRYRVPIRSYRSSVSDTGTNINHSPDGQVQNVGYSCSSQEILALMDNGCLEINEVQYVTSPSGESFGSNVQMRHLKHIRKSLQRYEPVCSYKREWKSDCVASLVCIIQSGDYYVAIDRDAII